MTSMSAHGFARLFRMLLLLQLLLTGLALQPTPVAASAVFTRVPATSRLTSATVNSTPTTSTYNNANELTSAEGTSYAYDARGNQLTKTSGGVTTMYAYDLLNRLTGITGPITASYTSNGDGERTSKTLAGEYHELRLGTQWHRPCAGRQQRLPVRVGQRADQSDHQPQHSPASPGGWTRQLTDVTRTPVCTETRDACGVKASQPDVQPYRTAVQDIDGHLNSLAALTTKVGYWTVAHPDL